MIENIDWNIGRIMKTIRNSNRYEDTGYNAWKAFNRIQESILKGGVNIRSITSKHLEEKNPYGKRRKAKGITALTENIRINQSLWDMTHELVA